MVFPEQWQQQNIWAGQYGLQPPPSAHPEMGMSYASSVRYDGNYPYQQNNFNMGLHTIHNQNAPATTATFAPWHSVQQNVTAPPPVRQDSSTSAQAAHPSDIVNSLDEAMASMPPHDWRCPLNDATLPATNQDREQWVQMLLNAVNNLTGIEGNQGKQNNEMLKKRWLEPLTGTDYYRHVDKLFLCWTIEDLVERLHRVGPSVLHSIDGVFWESAAKTSDWTFQCRITKIVELLAVSKTRCDSLFGGSGMQSIVANPGEKIAAIKVQARQNAKRGEILQLGRAVRKQKTGRAVKRQKASAHE